MTKIPSRPGFVVDASVVLKWFSQSSEEDLKSALRLREDYRKRDIDILAPNLLIYEAVNVLRYKDIVEDMIAKAVASLYAMDILVPVGPDTMTEAIRLARRFDVTVYDSVYLSLALSCGCRLLTADRQFFRKLSKMPGMMHISGY